MSNVVDLSRYADFLRGGDGPAVTGSANRPPLTAHLARLPDPRAIPPREWMYGRILIRKFCSVLVAPGGVGKTAIASAITVSLALGRGLIGDWVHAPTNVLVFSLEDPEDEFDRRTAATMLFHRIERPEVEGKIHVECGRDRRLVVAQYSPQDQITWFPDKPLVTAYIKEHGIGVVIVDPFVNSHEVDENSNAQVNAAIRAWAEIANDCNCAVLLIHHTRKGSAAGLIENARGAAALIDGARTGFTLAAMAPEEAEGFGIPDKDRKLHIRLDDGKANLSPPAEGAKWFRLASVELGNATEAYRFGDSVQAVEKWTPPALFKEMTPDLINQILDRIGAGYSDGVLYRPTMIGGSSPRWCGNVVVELAEVTDEQAKKVIKTWLRSGLLYETVYDDKNEGKKRKGVLVNDTKRP